MWGVRSNGKGGLIFSLPQDSGSVLGLRCDLALNFQLAKRKVKTKKKAKAHHERALVARIVTFPMKGKRVIER